MAQATIEQIKELRKATGAGVTAVKEALETSDGDLDKAIVYLREKGVAKAAKRAGKEVRNGYIGKYVHNNSRMVTLVELGCETDFAANSESFMEFADKLALHVAANSTQYVAVDRIPADVMQTEKNVYQKDVEGKPEEVAEKILEGKLKKFYEENVLLEQEMFGTEGVSVQDALNELIAQIGEKIVVGRMVTFHIGHPTVMDLG